MHQVVETDVRQARLLALDAKEQRLRIEREQLELRIKQFSLQATKIDLEQKHTDNRQKQIEKAAREAERAERFFHEGHKLDYDWHKHLSTLSTASMIIVAALSGSVLLEFDQRWLLVVSFGLFGA